MIVEMVRRRDSQNGYGQGAPYLAARTAKTAALETRADQSGQQLPRTCYSPLFRSSWQPGNRSTGRLQPPVGAHHHSPLQRGRAGRNRVVALLPRSPWAATVHCRSRRADRRGRPLAAAETHRHDAMVAGQTAGIPGCAEDHRRDQPGMAPLSAAALPGPLAAHEDLERVERPGVLAQIPPLAAALPQAARRRAATVRGRIWPVESPAPTRRLLGGKEEAGGAAAGDLPSPRRRAALPCGLRPGNGAIVQGTSPRAKRGRTGSAFFAGFAAATRRGNGFTSSWTITSRT